MTTKTRIVCLLLAVVATLSIVLALWHPGSEPDTTGPRANIQLPEATPPTDTIAIPTGPLRVEHASPPPRIAPPQPEPSPAVGQASLEIGRKNVRPKNHSGLFERVSVRSNEPVPIHLSWPEDTIHTDVFVQAVDGGKINGRANHERFDLGDEKAISFTFTPDQGPGSYNVVLRRGNVEEALQFWVSTGNRGSDRPTINGR